MRKFIVAVFIGCLFSTLSVAEQSVRLIAVQGESKVELEPNRAILSLEVMQTSAALEDARQGVSAALRSVAALLNKHGISDTNIEKTQIWQGPNYQWERDRQVIKGYNARIQLRVTLDDLEQMAKLADSLSAITQVTFHHTAFTRSDEVQLQVEQRKLALLDARQKAEAMVAVYNERLGRVLTIRESGISHPVAYRRMEAKAMSAAMDAAPEPASWAKVTVGANVQVEFGIQ
ncbi:MAG: SIMPL domain-containing protein [Nitrosomonas sp.]|nr:MAG: SIMPL domain-containing protein [Nitrosomonas sp.]